MFKKPLHHRAYAAIDRGDLPEAAQLFDRLIERSPKNTAYRYMAGLASKYLRDWPTSLRRVAVLALHGLSAEEIRWILALSPEAFRQRLSRIRKALGALPPEARAESLALAYVRDPARSADLAFGLIRRRLRAALGGSAGLATHDVDGHLLVIRRPGHTWGSGGNG